jgi:hypothetical protein
MSCANVSLRKSAASSKSTRQRRKGSAQPDETVNAIEFIYEQGWTDGLPIAPPTVEKARAMVERSGRAADELIAELPPKGGKATVEKIATNAVMAGCLPAYMPVVLTPLEAMRRRRAC